MKMWYPTALFRREHLRGRAISPYRKAAPKAAFHVRRYKSANGTRLGILGTPKKMPKCPNFRITFRFAAAERAVDRGCGRHAPCADPSKFLFQVRILSELLVDCQGRDSVCAVLEVLFDVAHRTLCLRTSAVSPSLVLPSYSLPLPTCPADQQPVPCRPAPAISPATSIVRRPGTRQPPRSKAPQPRRPCSGAAAGGGGADHGGCALPARSDRRPRETAASAVRRRRFWRPACARTRPGPGSDRPGKAPPAFAKTGGSEGSLNPRTIAGSASFAEQDFRISRATLLSGLGASEGVGFAPALAIGSTSDRLG